MAEAAPDPGPVVEWLIGQALLASPIDRLLSGCVERVAQMGLPVLRAHLSATTLHPQFEAVSLIPSLADNDSFDRVPLTACQARFAQRCSAP